MEPVWTYLQYERLSFVHAYNVLEDESTVDQ